MIRMNLGGESSNQRYNASCWTYNKFQMQNQVRLTLISQNNRKLHTLPVRAHSQPNYKVRNNNRIKINLRRLPTDFFSGPSSMPEINSLCKISSKCQSVIQSMRHPQPPQNTNNLAIRMPEFHSGPRELRSYKSEKRNREPNLNTDSSEVSCENSNMMNWTFSRQLFSQQKRQKALSGSKYKIPTERSQSLEKEGSKKVQSKSSRVAGGEQGVIRNINNLLSDKIAELNLNRLRMNIRKNNHPQQTMQFIRKYCG